jgi:hypothetical protein
MGKRTFRRREVHRLPRSFCLGSYPASVSRDANKLDGAGFKTVKPGGWI